MLTTEMNPSLVGDLSKHSSNTLSTIVDENEANKKEILNLRKRNKELEQLIIEKDIKINELAEANQFYLNLFQNKSSNTHSVFPLENAQINQAFSIPNTHSLVDASSLSPENLRERLSKSDSLANDQLTSVLQVTTNPPSQAVYQRILRPFPTVTVFGAENIKRLLGDEEYLSLSNAGKNANGNLNLFVEVSVLKANEVKAAQEGSIDPNIEAERKTLLSGNALQRMELRGPDTLVAVFRKLKVMSTNVQLGTNFFLLKFTLKKYIKNDFEAIKGVSPTISSPLEIFSHSIYLKDKNASSGNHGILSGSSTGTASMSEEIDGSVDNFGNSLGEKTAPKNRKNISASSPSVLIPKQTGKGKGTRSKNSSTTGIHLNPAINNINNNQQINPQLENHSQLVMVENLVGENKQLDSLQPTIYHNHQIINNNNNLSNHKGPNTKRKLAQASADVPKISKMIPDQPKELGSGNNQTSSLNESSTSLGSSNSMAIEIAVSALRDLTNGNANEKQQAETETKKTD